MYYIPQCKRLPGYGQKMKETDNWTEINSVSLKTLSPYNLLLSTQLCDHFFQYVPFPILETPDSVTSPSIILYFMFLKFLKKVQMVPLYVRTSVKKIRLCKS